MHGVKDIIRDAESLPAEERIAVIDSLLRTLNRPSPEIDKAWIKVTKARLAELRSGKVKAIPGDQIFAKIKERFDK
ncbi:MAG TPA: addiction module protein [Candidatus Rifleibacterium sp.]|nr:addiction module protein [Candidatus Rifleibacterium sp.]